MRVLDTASIRWMDARMIGRDCPEGRLMGRAVRGLARMFLEWLGPPPRRVLVCAGPGNNGGDGLGLALHLHEAGHSVFVRVAAPEDRITGDARIFLELARNAGVSLAFVPAKADWDADAAETRCYDWVVDALLGSGSEGAPRGTLAAAVRAIQALRAHSRILAIDLPSGFHADRGLPFDADLCVRADFTLIPGAIPPGFLEAAAAEFCGSVTGIDLGYDPEELQDAAVRPEEVMDPERARRLSPARRVAESHKGTYGHVRVWGGSPGMLGAPILAGRAALQCGAGRVTLHLPPASVATVNAANPELMVGDEETLMSAENDAVLLLGPGLAVTEETRGRFRALLKRFEGPVVLDAGALRLLAEAPGFLRERKAPVWITPHPGEAAALLDCTIEELVEDRGQAARLLRNLTGAHVILKGHQSLVSSRLRRDWINLNGNAMLATAGSGDVLAGLLAALIAQKVPEEEAAPLAVFLHAAAADSLSARSRSGRATALDLLHQLG